jgi:signal transduction histidine kinase
MFNPAQQINLAAERLTSLVSQFVVNKRPLSRRLFGSFAFVILSFLISMPFAQNDRAKAVIINFAGTVGAITYGGFAPGLLAGFIHAIVIDYFFLVPINHILGSKYNYILFGIYLLLTLSIQSIIAALRKSVFELGFSCSQFEAAIRSRDDVLLMVSHDLKNPLNSIMLNSQLIGKKGIDKSIRPNNKVIEQSARNMQRMINDLMDFGSIKKGTLSFSLTLVNTYDFIKSVSGLYQSIAKDKKIELKTIEKDGLPKFIRIDSERMSQALGNLFSNAFKYRNPNFPVVFEVYKQNNLIVFCVSNHGAKISDESLRNMFDPYWKMNSKGLGLGLYIVKNIATAHHGRVFVSSKDDMVDFSILIPAA